MTTQMLLLGILDDYTEYWVEIIFRKSFRHWKTGKIVYAEPGHPFPIRIKHYR